MSLSCLTQNEVADWTPWFWVILAYKWTADQGKPVPPLTPAWRTRDCDVDHHAQTLIRLWLPSATDVTLVSGMADAQLHLSWRDARLFSYQNIAFCMAIAIFSSFSTETPIWSLEKLFTQHP